MRVLTMEERAELARLAEVRFDALRMYLYSKERMDIARKAYSDFEDLFIKSVHS